MGKLTKTRPWVLKQDDGPFVSFFFGDGVNTGVDGLRDGPAIIAVAFSLPRASINRAFTLWE